MSLVERALKKLQESRGSAPASTGATASRAAPKSSPPPPAAPRGERPMTPVETTRVISIDREALRRMELLPPANYERQIASQYQHIKRPLVASVLNRDPALGSTPHIIMMASALSGEGKTFTSINLALSLALEKDVEVLLVDADVRKPHVSRIFGMEKEKGLIDLLTDNALQPSQVILRTDVPNLSVMPAGQPIETATELLASERMRDVAAQLAAPDGRRIVLLDSPPLLMSTESIALSTSAGQVVLVVRAEVTAQQAVKDAIATIASNKPISLILNQTSTPPSAGYYGYGSYGDASPPKDGA
ncbi:MAG TPA: AAA family ATPase [Steroidobacteraceae bacterium]|nr:AAA family ATPase [Steroidobacteraceae bacterium]